MPSRNVSNSFLIPLTLSFVASKCASNPLYGSGIWSSHPATFFHTISNSNSLITSSRYGMRPSQSEEGDDSSFFGVEVYSLGIFNLINLLSRSDFISPLANIWWRGSVSRLISLKLRSKKRNSLSFWNEMFSK